ncbi:MAG: site-2 protease family protein [Spirochaetes bacterium]|nr:site-2 protease family protein [Spirochaetota bacterium]
MQYAAAFVIIGLVILIHEAGHFLAARITGIPVKIFSVGFGPRLFSRSMGGTEFRISLFPVGGYLLPDIEDEKDYFAIPILKRIVFAAGGPVINILAAVLLLGVVRAAQGAGPLGAAAEGIADAARTLAAMAASIPRIVGSPESLSGVVGIVAQGGDFIAGGLLRALRFSALISLNLALINLLPFPVFDGGKMLLCAAEGLHPALRRLHVPLSIAGWVLVLFLMVYVTVVDIGRII